MDTGIPWDATTSGMPDIGLVLHMAAHIGWVRATTAAVSMPATGMASVAGANTTITGTANMIAIFANMTVTSGVRAKSYRFSQRDVGRAILPH